MAHFAELDQDGRVVRVVVVANAAITVNGLESEQRGVDLLESLHGHRRWKQTSYSGKIRKNFAGVGMRYDSERDAFIGSSPYASWLLDETTCRWVAPAPRPSVGLHRWDEARQAWVALYAPKG